MISRTLSDLFDELLAVDRSSGFSENWLRPRWMVVMVWWLMRVSTMVVMVMVRRMRD
jgi:hypothetical protein